MSIPNRAMFYWSGGPLSWMRANTLWSFRKLHPDWEMILFFGFRATSPPAEQPTWAEERQDWQGEQIISPHLIGDICAGFNVKVEPWHCPPAYPQATPVQENDLCRWGALSKFGGWFFDLDFLFVDRIERIGVPAEADAVFIPARDWIPTGFIGAAAGNDFTAAMYAAALAAPDKTRYRAAGSEAIARICNLNYPWYQHTTGLLSRSLAATFPQVRFHFPGVSTAYRWEWFDAGKIFSGSETVLQKTVAIHWFGGSRIGQRWQRKMTEDNFRQFNCPYSSYCGDLAEATEFV